MKKTTSTIEITLEQTSCLSITRRSYTVRTMPPENISSISETILEYGSRTEEEEKKDEKDI